ncbi:MAG: lycopene cyclase domain-containing protein [Nanoarchaeota archaeon]
MVAYPYLLSSVILGIIWLILFIRRKDLRKEMLIIGFIFIPSGLTQALYVPDYWQPRVIHQFFGLFDIESLLHVFFIFGIAAVLYKEIKGYKLKRARGTKTTRISPHIIFCLGIFIGVVTVLFKVLLDVPFIHTSLFALMLISVYLILMRPDLFREIVWTSVIFSLLYISATVMFNALFSFVANNWNPNGNWGIYLLGVPLEEYLYGLMVGIIGSVLYEELTNMKLKKIKG